MSNNSDKIVQQIRSLFELLLANIQANTDDPPSAYAMERRLFTDLLALGRSMLQCFYCVQQAALSSVETVNVGDKCLPRKGLRLRSVRSVFGKFTIERSYYYADNRINSNSNCARICCTILSELLDIVVS